MKEYYKLEFYVPESHAEEVKAAVLTAGAGRLGNYSCCCWESSGEGQFCPEEGSKPFIGQTGEIEKVLEIKVEMICDESLIKKAVRELKNSHPYETPAYQYWKVRI